MKPIELKEVIQNEQEQLHLRRQKLGIEHGTEQQPNWFGIALSGGGIRSATINLGFLKTLNKYGILQKADYLSTVSGGGYTHEYVQGTAKATGDFSKLFSTEHIEDLRKHGEYMVPHTGILGKSGNALLLVIAFLVSWLMSLVSPAIVIGIGYYLYLIVTSFLGKNPFAGFGLMDGQGFAEWAMAIAVGVFALHFLMNILLNFHLGVSKIFNRAESGVVLIGLFLYAWMVVVGFEGTGKLDSGLVTTYACNALLLFLIGFFTDPNALSFHRYYRKQLADLFLQFSGDYSNMKLREVFDAKSNDPKKYISPYPLINTCLNLMNPNKDPEFQGTKTSDYFLLSPLYCGSKIVKYVPTNHFYDYERMTLPAAVTISAAAVNPGMGMYSNKFLSLLMTVFNARLGFWISNPKVLVKARALVWWPMYFFYELLGRIGSGKKMINISDGGHIENLGAYELLRRKCRLILCVDAGEDKAYSFDDLNNFLIRARNELGLEIRFRDGQHPEDLIRPRPSQVYSKKRFAIADIYKCWEEVPSTDPKDKDGKKIINYSEDAVKPEEKMVSVGTFVYIKSSVLAPKGKPDLDKNDELKYGTYKYKIYHPDFPHEPTSDQFFDKIQWESYFRLGRFMGAEVLGLEDLEVAVEKKPSVEQLLDWFDNGVNFFAPQAEAAAVPTGGEFESYKLPAEQAPPSRAIPEEVKYQM